MPQWIECPTIRNRGSVVRFQSSRNHLTAKTEASVVCGGASLSVPNAGCSVVENTPSLGYDVENGRPV